MIKLEGKGPLLGALTVKPPKSGEDWWNDPLSESGNFTEIFTKETTMSSSRYWMQTFTGRPFRFDEPFNLEIELKDIARPLSRICRFGGHTNSFLSVAEHSMAVHWLIHKYNPDNRLLQMHALLHDAHEAFFGDLVSPFKRFLAEQWHVDISGMQAIAQTNILAAFGIPLLESMRDAEAIHEADLACTKCERDCYMASPLEWDLDHVTYPPDLPKVYPRLSSNEAFGLFMDTFNEIKDRLNAQG